MPLQFSMPRTSLLLPARLAAGILLLLLPVAAIQARIKIHPASVEIGMADVIVIAKASRFIDMGADAPDVIFAVQRYLRGSGPRDELTVGLAPGSELVDADAAPGSPRCGRPVDRDPEERSLEGMTVVGGFVLEIRCRDSYLLYLGHAPQGRYRLQRAFSVDDIERLEILHKLLPHIPPWGAPRQGLAAILVTDMPRVAAGEDIEVSLGLKNVGAVPLRLHLGGTRDQRSHFTLSIDGPDGRVIDARPHPELDQDSMDHFFRHMSAVKTLTLKPGEATFLPAEPINSAGGGWGYKERLDFSYYPMPLRGRYRIVATAHRFLPDVAPMTPPLEIWVD